MRAELTQLERFVLLQILDQAWKDHLYGMDQLKDSVGLRGYAEKDPRIEYKREGANHFREMQRIVRDRVTDLIFRAKLTPNVQLRSVYAKQEARHDQAGPAVGAGAREPALAAAAAQQGTQQQRADLAAAEQAGSHGRGGAPMTRKQRRAAEARERQSKGHDHKQRKRKSR
jgi:preprotein translocase subunit SecA